MEHRADEVRMMMWLDGELSGLETETLRLHLEGCQLCREQLRELERGLAAFAEYRRKVSVPAAGRPPCGWKEFPHLLDGYLDLGRGA